MKPLDHDPAARHVRRAAATLTALADQLKAGGVDDTFVRTIRSDGAALLKFVEPDEEFEQVLRDVSRHLPGRKLGAT